MQDPRCQCSAAQRDFPPDVLKHILLLLPVDSRLQYALVNTNWHSAACATADRLQLTYQHPFTARQLVRYLAAHGQHVTSLKLTRQAHKALTGFDSCSTPCPNLRQLELQGLRDRPCTLSHSAVGLWDSLATLTRLTQLSLSDVTLHAWQDHPSLLLSNLTQLQDLHWANVCRARSGCPLALGSGISHLPHLTRLSVKITGEGDNTLDHLHVLGNSLRELALSKAYGHTFTGDEVACVSSCCSHLHKLSLVNDWPNVVRQWSWLTDESELLELPRLLQLTALTCLVLDIQQRLDVNSIAQLDGLQQLELWAGDLSTTLQPLTRLMEVTSLSVVGQVPVANGEFYWRQGATRARFTLQQEVRLGQVVRVITLHTTQICSELGSIVTAS